MNASRAAVDKSPLSLRSRSSTSGGRLTAILTFIGTSRGDAACKSYVPNFRTIQRKRKVKRRSTASELGSFGQWPGTVGSRSRHSGRAAVAAGLFVAAIALRFLGAHRAS